MKENVEEKIFLSYGNVLITSTRIVVDERTIALANVTSVRGSTRTHSAWKDPFSIRYMLWMLGIGYGLIAVFFGKSLLFLGGVLLLIFSLFWIVSDNTQPNVHIVTINLAGYDWLTLAYDNSESVQTVVNAINQAIIHRG